MNTALKLLIRGNYSQIQSVKYYVKPLKRRPLNVFTFEEIKKLKNVNPHSNTNSNTNSNQMNEEINKGVKTNNQFFDSTKKTIYKYNDRTEITFKYLKNEDERFGRTVNEVKLRIDGSSKILLEGVRLITEAINQRVIILSLFFTDKKILNQLPCDRITNLSECKIYKVSEKQMKLWSETKGPSGLMAIAIRPKTIPMTSTTPHLPMTLIIDELNDAGQLGTLIRSAVAASIQRVIVIQGEVGPWSAKVLRAGMGAHFHHKIETSQWENIHTYINNNKYITNNSNDMDRTHIYILNAFNNEILTDLPKSDKSIEVVNNNEFIKFESNSFIIIGRESPTKNLLNLLDAHKAKNNEHNNKIIIINYPDRNDVKMNQAMCGSVMLYEIKRQLES